jgi:hypothetical protein
METKDIDRKEYRRPRGFEGDRTASVEMPLIPATDFAAPHSVAITDSLPPWLEWPRRDEPCSRTRVVVWLVVAGFFHKWSFVQKHSLKKRIASTGLVCGFLLADSTVPPQEPSENQHP